MQHLRFAYAVNDFKYVVGVRGDVQHRTAHISTRAHLTHRTKPRWESRRSHHITPGSSRGGHKMNYWRLRINSPTRIPAMTQTRDAGSSRPDPHAGHQASVTHSSTASKSGGGSRLSCATLTTRSSPDGGSTVLVFPRSESSQLLSASVGERFEKPFGLWRPRESCPQAPDAAMEPASTPAPQTPWDAYCGCN